MITGKSNVTNLEKWFEAIRMFGCYKWPISCSQQYELYIVRAVDGQNVYDADGILCKITFKETTESEKRCFLREKIFSGTVKECLKAAEKDLKGGKVND